jgi:abortive infection bacteriophage resistance protein
MRTRGRLFFIWSGQLKFKTILKTSLTHDEQIKRIKSRGLIIDDEDFVKKILLYHSYHRINDFIKVVSNRNTTMRSIGFKGVYALYEFDRTLRQLLLTILEPIEVSLKAHVINLIATKYGPTGYVDHQNFNNPQYHEQFLRHLKDQFGHNGESLDFNRIKNNDGFVPVWMALEGSSFGLVSQLYSNLTLLDQGEIGLQYYGIKPHYLRTWYHSLASIRNICAHYGRLSYRTLKITPKLFDKEKKARMKNDSIFAILYIMGKLSTNHDQWQGFLTNLKELIYQTPSLDVSSLGLIEGWDETLSQL